jgi:hypothetical protein
MLKNKRGTPRVVARLTEPRVYSIVLFSRDKVARSLWTGVAYDFEEAVENAMLDAVNNLGDDINDIPYWKPMLFSYLEIDDIKKYLFEAPKIDKGKDDNNDKSSIYKNNLIKRIIQTKSKKLFIDNIELFSKAERMFIESHLKKSRKK